ncbi:MAG: BatD family protein, partial [Longimicrobiales bacterium]
QSLDQDPDVPELSAFARYLGSGTSTSMRMMNGRTSVALTIQHRFQALTLGQFQIGPLVVEAGGESLRTDPLTVTIRDAPTHSGGGATSQQDPVSPEDLFVEAEISRRRAFENEPIVVEYRIFTSVNVESYSITNLPAATGFWTEELEQSESPQVEQVVREGQQYASAVVRRVALFPTGVGSKVLDPLTLEAQVRVRRRSQDPFRDLLDPLGNRNGLFGTLVPASVSTRPISIEILPLPAEGRPESFSGHVGPLSVSSTVDRTELQANEAVTFRVDYSGAGNLRSIPPPDIEFPPELEVFPPEASEEVTEGGGSIRGSRSFRYVIIPRVPGEVELPAVHVAAYQPRADRYEASSAEPITLSVIGPSDGASLGGRLPSSVNSIREEIRFIDVGSPNFVRADRSLFNQTGFWIVLFLPLVALLGAFAMRGHLERLEGDVAYARHRGAKRVAKKRLASARRSASQGSREFYGEVAGALQGFLADKLNLSEAGLVRDQLEAHQGEGGLSEATLARVTGLLDECDRHRFAPADEFTDTHADVLERAQKLMADLDRELA